MTDVSVTKQPVRYRIISVQKKKMYMRKQKVRVMRMSGLGLVEG